MVSGVVGEGQASVMVRALAPAPALSLSLSLAPLLALVPARALVAVVVGAGRRGPYVRVVGGRNIFMLSPWRDEG